MRAWGCSGREAAEKAGQFTEAALMGAMPMYVPDFKNVVMPAIIAALDEWKRESERSECRWGGRGGLGARVEHCQVVTGVVLMNGAPRPRSFRCVWWGLCKLVFRSGTVLAPAWVLSASAALARRGSDAT